MPIFIAIRMSFASSTQPGMPIQIGRCVPRSRTFLIQSRMTSDLHVRGQMLAHLVLDPVERQDLEARIAQEF